MKRSEGPEQATAEPGRRRRLVFLVSGLLDFALAAAIGFLGLEFADGETTVDPVHGIGAALLAVMGLATIWWGWGRTPIAGNGAASVFKG